MNLPFDGRPRRVKAPKAPRRLSGEEAITSSEHARAAEGAGGAADVDAGGWADISGNRRATTRSYVTSCGRRRSFAH
jgi:hypothetical protein